MQGGLVDAITGVTGYRFTFAQHFARHRVERVLQAERSPQPPRISSSTEAPANFSYGPSRFDRKYYFPDPDLDQRVARQRETTRVKVVLPQSGRWAADFYAESVTVVQDDEESVEVDLDLAGLDA